MLPATSLYRAALPYPHQRITRVEVWHGGVLVEPDLPINSGEVTASLTSRVTRSLRLSVDAGLYPETADALLAPEIALLRVYTGIGYPDGSSELFPVFVGRVATPSENPDGTVTVQADDLAADVIGYRFESPEPSHAGASITSEIRRLITQALPSATFGTDDVDPAITPTLVWDQDRGQALDDLAAAVGGRWYALGDGSFVVRAYPYDLGTPVVTLTDGQGSDQPGTIAGVTRQRTRNSVYNSVTVSSERLDGTDPVRVTRRNITTGSPTEFGDAFGRVSTIISVQTPLTASEAAQLAVQQLNASTALAEQWTIDTIPDATLEPGDTALATWRGHTTTQVIDSITYPLGTGDTMRITARSSITGVTQ